MNSNIENIYNYYSQLEETNKFKKSSEIPTDMNIANCFYLDLLSYNCFLIENYVSKKNVIFMNKNLGYNFTINDVEKICDQVHSKEIGNMIPLSFIYLSQVVYYDYMNFDRTPKQIIDIFSEYLRLSKEIIILNDFQNDIVSKFFIFIQNLKKYLMDILDDINDETNKKRTNDLFNEYTKYLYTTIDDENNIKPIPSNNSDIRRNDDFSTSNVDSNTLDITNNEKRKLKNFSEDKYPMPSSNLNALFSELNSMIGLENVKREIDTLVNLIKIRKLKQKRGYTVKQISMHMVFYGNPGTGKTTIARLLSAIYKELGVLSKGHLIEVDRSKLVSAYIGQTAIQTSELLHQAIGGILFIDEAYTLTVDKGANDFGQEAVDTVLKGMEDYRNDLIVIVAGYPSKMREFLESNPGLKSRFNKFVNFYDYLPNQMLEIYKGMCKSQDFTLDFDAEELLKTNFQKKYNERDESFGNAREVRNGFEQAISNQANRLSALLNISNEELTSLTVEDVKEFQNSGF